MLTRKEALVNDILKIVSIKSFTGDQNGIAICQNEYRKIAERMGFVTYFKAENKVLIVEPSRMNSPPEIGMVVHLDTVPFDEKEWKYNPLGELNDGRLYGRGVLDDKAAAVMALYVVYELKDVIKESWQIIVGSCEEGDWSDMDLFMKENPNLAKFLFTIDGDGIQNGCRGYLDLQLEFRRRYRRSKNPMLTDIVVPNATNNVVPAMATAVVNGREYLETGVAVHSSIPEKGVNALLKLAEVLSKDGDVYREFTGFFELMKKIRNSDIQSVLWFLHDEIPYDTSIVPVDCKISDNRLLLTLNMRLDVRTNSLMVLKIIAYLSVQYDCNCYILDIKYPAYINPGLKYIREMVNSYKEVLGKETEVRIAKGTGYNAALPNCAIFGPRFSEEDDEIDYCHAVDENRRISDLFTFFEMLKLYLEKILSN